MWDHHHRQITDTGHNSWRKRVKAKILVIDDDTSLRRILEYNLQEEGYEVQATASGEEGLFLFKQFRPDLVITDMKMSGMDGLKVLNSIKESSPDTLVIIITAFGTVDVAVEAMKAGAYDYITKPFNREALKLTFAPSSVHPLRWKKFLR